LSAVYGALTVLFVLVGERLRLGAAGYGYLLSAVGVGGVLAAGLAQRAASSGRPRAALMGLDATPALTGALVLAYGAVAFTRPDPAPALQSA
jgi:hypothetical protein